jgi:P-type Ca2+ transporter type 2C
MQLPHTIEIEKLLKELNTSVKGLTKREVENRIKEHGENVLPVDEGESIIKLILKNLNNILTYVLLGAATISFLFDHHIDAYVILVVIVINAAIATRHEYSAIKTINSLKSLAVPKCIVIRNGQILKIESSTLVIGDIVLVKEGDSVPADLRIISAKDLAVIESSLTGEAKPVNKTEEVLEENIALGDMSNMLFMSTTVTAGEGKGVVVRTGTATEIGKIAKEMSQIKVERTLFDIRTEKLMKTMLTIAVGTALLTFIIGLIRQLEYSELFLFTVASLISAIPEGLPAVLTIALAVAANRMAVRKAVVRNLSSIETLSSVTTIITDKTGTLTQNTMTVEKMYLSDGRVLSITGKDWVPKGEFFFNDEIITPKKDTVLKNILPFLAIANNAQLVKKKSYSILGDPTEASRLVVASKGGFSKNDLLKERYRILDEQPYGQDTKYRGAILRDNITKKNYMVIVGAAERVLAKSKKIVNSEFKEVALNYKETRKINRQIKEWTKDAMRLQALSFKETNKSSFDDEKIQNMTLGCVLGILDPVRDDVYEAVIKTKKAGIKVIMATGDHKETAIAVARKVGIIDEDEKSKLLAYSEEELAKMSEKEFRKAINSVSVFSRLTPSTKLRIAQTLQKKGEIIAMTGDGVNDAMAIKKAHVGISMGNIGTDAAREASDIVIMDDNFATIVSAIEEGLTVFRNIKQTSTYLITTNLSEDFFIIISLIAGTPLPLLPIQILWLNLLTDGLLDVSLAMEKPRSDAWVKGIVKKEENIIGKDNIEIMVVAIVTLSIIALVTFNMFLPDGLDKARTAVFVVMTFSQVFFALVMRSMRLSLFSIGIFSNKFVFLAAFASIILAILLIEIPFLSNIFRFDTLSLIEFIYLFAFSFLILVVGEGYKAIKRIKEKEE